MTDKSRLPTRLADYSDLLSAGPGLPVPVSVGGQAANAWATYYSKRIGRKLSRYRPFTSKDLDLAGNRELLEHIKRITKGTAFIPSRGALSLVRSRLPWAVVCEKLKCCAM